MALPKPNPVEIAVLYAEWVLAGRPAMSSFAKKVHKNVDTLRRWFTNHEGGPVAPGPAAEDLLKDQIRTLEAQLKSTKRGHLDEHYVRSVILKMAEHDPNPPKWLAQPKASKSTPGVPTLFASDWHWAEVVHPKQVAGLNEYNLAIAHRRAKALITNTIDLLRNHMVNPSYPGIVFALGGDMVSGGIHEELLATDEVEIMPTVLDLFDVLVWCIETLAEEYGNVFIPCVTGNHGRSTKKIRAKGRNFTSYDWLTYQFLARHFANDTRIQFAIPDGSDCLYKVYNHRYLLTHGDQARGGDGVIGMLGPVIRMDHRKRSRNGQVGQNYDTMLMGHFHQLTQLRRLIVNGSLKGYCEYAYANSFGFEPPQQGLWLTHPSRGITFSMPVQVEKPLEIKSDWVSWK